ncbi:MAG: UvrD-helicase domain-containing protein [Flavobacteriales bacterium]|nr:UvrD-helicase domain-containing protein [Flavobacteriales bacterium]
MFVVLHSSAGAGKTHALVKNYLGHCLRSSDPSAYGHVLALTFTNKAAAEMKERVIGYLELLAHGEVSDARMVDVLEHLQREANVDPTVVKERASAVLRHMLHNWSDVAISTIDAFTQRVVRPFSRDLRLEYDLRMTTEQTYYREQAVERLIGATGSDDRITALLSQTCLQLLHEERSWNPTKPLLDLSYELLKESSIEPLQRLRAYSVDELTSLTQRLNQSNAKFRHRVNELGAQALELFAMNGLAEGDVAHGKSGILGYFRRLAQFDSIWDPPGVQALKPLESGKWHSGKATPSAIAALDSIADRLTDLFHQAEQLRTTDLRDHLIRKSVVRELLPAFALHELDAKLEALKQEDGVAFFSDLTRRVAEVVKDEPVPFIYERMGVRYRHFLIDEFQDTSLMQWKALLPLIDNALATGGSALLVGDAKQAIYRWRNGEVRLFVELPMIFGRSPNDLVEKSREDTLKRNHVKGERLAHNRRSAKHIIAFNNALFADLAKVLPESLRKVYDQHDQRTSHSEEGLVSVVQAEPGLRGAAFQEAALAHALGSLQAALDAGFEPNDVAVLVRSKRFGRAVAAHFLAHGHAVVSPDGLQLAADPVIQLLIELLRFLRDGEGITAARVIQLQSIVADLHGAPTGETTTPFTPSDTLPHPTHLLRTWFKEHGDPKLRTTITSLVSELARAHAIEPAADAAVLTLLDEIHSWSTDHGPDIGGFLEHWERSGGERSTAAPDHARAVHVMTVHKSKGLQFPVVIVPQASMSGGPSHGELFWIDPRSAIPELDVALIRESKVARAAELPELVEEEGLRTLDALNLLYVAFTRAERRLYALVPDEKDVVTKALAAFVASHEALAVTPDNEEPPPQRRSQDAPIALRGVAGLGASPATIRLEAEQDWDPMDPNTHRAFGTTIHTALEETRVPADLEVALLRAVQRGELASSQVAPLLARLFPMLHSDALAPWFAPHLDVRAESTLIDKDGHSLRPDRLVFDGECVRVLEFKTGKHASAHEDQVRRYLHLLRELGHSNVEGAVWYLFDDRLHPVSP